MRSLQYARLGPLLVLSLAFAPANAQTLAPPIPPTTEAALHAMTQSAAVIFSGQVTAIHRHERVVEIDFAVEDAIRGVSGSTYTLREWAGLWNSGDEPLHAGQRYLMLLHAPGRSGLTSPVRGADGAIPILGNIDRRPATVAENPAAADGRVVDLRWVEARVARTVEYAAEPQSRPISQPFRLRAETRTAQVNLTTATPSLATAQNGTAYTAVIGVLRSWEHDAAR